MDQEFRDRLEKNVRRRRRWADREGLTAYRVYDRDIPAWPVAVDVYGDFAHVVDYPSRRQLRSGRDDAMHIVAACVAEVLGVAPERTFIKTHLAKPWAYGRQAERGVTTTVRERGLSYECNLSDYLDTGLFLDGREARARIRSQAKSVRFLNLFSYTGAFTVAAAAGGASSSVSVDLSATYGAWARRNLVANGITDGDRHVLVRSDVMQWIRTAPASERFDLVVIDPPSFSRSSRMEKRFEVQRDHAKLVKAAFERVAPGGDLYFATHFRGFVLDPSLSPAKELSSVLAAADFRDPALRTFHWARA